ncbi:MAG: hypothetical protein H7X93_04390 [Sphingomonadaceae bacterium]|nr:hypothetical protein [Sphingomonadaceae bacterium]
MASAPVYPRFSFGKTISDTFSVIGGNFGALIALCFLFSALPGLVFNYFYFSAMMGASANPYDAFGYLTGLMGATFIGGVLTWILFCLLETAIIRASLLHFRGERASIGDSIAFALGKLLPVLAVSFLGWAAIGVLAFVVVIVFFFLIGATIATGDSIGAVLAVLFLLPLMMVPVIFFMIVWLVQIPAYVAERIGVFDSFARSWRLTRGARWKILALCILYFVAIYIIFAVLLGVGLAMGGMGMMTAFDPTGSGVPSAAMLIPTIIMQAISSMIAALVGLPGLAALYANLRESKEGVNRDSIADVFG